jgi:hypothetical protein
LTASRRQILLQDKHEDYVALGGKIRDVLGDDCAVFCSRSCGNLRVVGGPQAHLADVDGVLAVALAQ